MNHIFQPVILLCSLFFISGSLFSQEWIKNIPAGKENNFFEIRKAFENYWAPYKVENGYYMKNGQKTKAPYWKLFQRWAYYWESRVNQRTGEFPNISAVHEFQKFRQIHPKTENSGGNWSSLGPNSSDGGYAGIGRINCISFHPSDANTFWVGAASGGVWKTVNGGSSWTVLTDNNMVMGASDIGVPSDYATSNTLYIATGDKDGGSMWSLEGGQYNDNESIGVLKSTDGGANWFATGLTFTIDQHRTVSRILIHPTSTNILWASTSVGVYISSNGGTSWTLQQSGNFIDMEFKPGNPNTIYASTMSYSGAPAIYKTTNGGAGWAAIKTFVTSDWRVDMAVSQADSNGLWVIVCNTSSGLSGIHKSANSGTSFTARYTGGTNKALLGWYSSGTGTNEGQGSYDLAIAVSPTDTSTVFIGGVNTHKSTNGGSSWYCINCWTSSSPYNTNGAPEVHADQHMLAYQPGTNVLFETNDGGVYKTTNGGTSWIDLTNGIVPSQIYRMSTAQNSSTEILCGLQDNGSKLRSGGTWYDVTGGDGMDCMIDYTDYNVQYATYANGTLYRTTNHWSGSSTITPSGYGTGHWVTPLAIDPSNNQTIYCGYSNLLKSTNRGTNWTAISTMNSSDKIRAIAVAPSNNQYIYVSDPNQIWVTTNGGTNWTERTTGLPVSTNSITYIAVKHNDPNTVWVSMGGYDAQRVYESTDRGANWTNISTGLPNIPVMCIIQNKINTTNNELYVGTDRGVFSKTGSNSWQEYNYNLPNVVITDLDIYYDASVPANSKLRAGSYGRGLWESGLPAGSSIGDPSNFNASGVSSSQINLSWQKNVSNNNVLVSYNTTSTFGTPVNGTSYSAGNSIPGGGTVLYNGSGTTYNHTGLSAATRYYYKAWSVDGSNMYSVGISDDTVTLCGSVTLPLTENFAGSALPSCWSTQNTGTGITERWSVSATVNAGGSANEIRCAYQNINPGTTRLITPPINTAGMSQINLSFKHMLDDYGPGATLRVQSSVDGVNWTNEAWSLATVSNSNVGPATINTTVTNNLNSANTYIAFVITGNLFQFDYWYIDDVSITAGTVNQPPYVANALRDTTFTEDFGRLFVRRLTTVFNDPDNPTLTYGASVLSGGKVTVSIGGDSLYINSARDSNGTANIRVTAYDGLTTVADTFVVTVTSVNDAPVVATAIPDTTLNEDFGKVFRRKLTSVFRDADNPSLTYGFNLLSSGVNAMISGDTLYVVSVRDSIGIKTIRVTASDGSLIAADTFAVTVTPVNDAPYVALAIPDTTFSEDFGRRFIRRLPNVFADVDNGSLTYAANVLSGSVTASISNDSLYINSVLNYTGAASIRVTASDGSLSAADTFAVTLTPVNDAPYVALAIPDTTFSEDFGRRFIRRLPNVFADVDNGSLTYAANVLSGSVTTSISNDSLYINSVLNYTGSASIRVTASDGSLSAADTFAVTLTPVNDAPYVALAVHDTFLVEDFGKAFIAKLNQVFADVDNGSLTYAASNLSAGVNTLISNDSLYLLSVLDFVGSANIRLTAFDGQYTVADTFLVNVVDETDPPFVANPLRDTTFTEDFGRRFVGKLTEVFNDVDTPVLTYGITALDAGVTANIVQDSLFVNSVMNFNGVVRLRATANDGATTVADTFIVTVTPVNDAPYKISSLRDTTFSENFGRVGIADLNTVFDDVDNVSLSFTTSASGAGIVPGVSGDTLYINSTLNFNGIVDVYVNATDGEYTARDTFQVTVAPVNNAPYRVAMLRDTTFSEDFGHNFVYRLSQFFADVDDPTLNYNATASGAGIVPEVSGDTLFVSSTLNFNGMVEVYVSATDGEFTAYDTFTVNVTPVNDAPYKMASMRDTTFSENFGRVGIADLNTVFDDVDNVSLSFTTSASGAGIVPGVSGDTLYINSTLNFNGIVDVYVNATDGEYTARDTFQVTVAPVNNAPYRVAMLRDTTFSEDFGHNFVYRLSQFFADVDDPTLNYNATASGAGIVPEVSGDTLFVSSTLNFNGMVEVYVSATDGEFTAYDTFKVTVTPVNDIPSVFALVSPADGDTLASFSAPVGFTWNPSFDADGDPLHYALSLFHPAFDTLINGIADTTVYVDLSKRLLFNNPYRWTVSVSDGFLTVASADTYLFRTPVLVGIPEDNLLPSVFALKPNFPNPFNPSTTIHYDLPKSSNVRLNIYNIQGQLVRTLVNGQKTAGRYQVIWDGRGEHGQIVSSGIYMYRIQTGDFVKTRKMMLLK